MKYYIIKSVLSIVFVFICNTGYAINYGENKTLCDIRYYVTSGTVSVHTSNSKESKTIRTINAGDYIYVDNDVLYYNGDEAWVKVSGKDEYILSYLLTIDDNPYYEPQIDNNLLESKESIFKFGYYNLPKWLVITMLCVWMLLSLFLCLTLSDYKMDLRWCPPDKTPKVLNKIDPEYGYGQSKVLFFSQAPYKLFAIIAAFFLGAFIVTIILFILTGSLVWLCTWTGRILLVGLFWIILIGLYILGGGLFFNAIVGEKWRFWSFALSWIPIVFAIKMGPWASDVYEWGRIMTNWGGSVFTTFNIFKVTIYIIKTYWLTALLISIAPFALFVSAAGIFMIFAGSLMLYENIKMKRYNVTHPCPFCGEHSEPAVYLSNGIPLHVPLRPSVWGLFYIKHPATGEKMPTLFLNGKDRLERRCIHCDGLISATIGEEKHIAVAGVPNSGKSTLLYRIISELCRMQIGNEHICRFTDEIGDNEASAKIFLDSIKDGQKMKFYPEKNATGRHKSIQLLAQNPNGSLPYRLYINDIAGEIFTSTNNQYEDAPFFKNTNVLIFALDPFTMKANELTFSPKFASWYKTNVGDKNNIEGKVDLDEAFSTLTNTIAKYRKKEDISKIRLMITYVKTDTGYLNEISNKNDGVALREFAISEMGLENLIYKIESEGFGVSYHSTSASDDAAKSGISAFIDELLEHLEISFKKLSEKQLADRNAKILMRDIESKKRQTSIENYVPKNPNIDHTFKGSMTVLSSFIIGGLIIWGGIKISSNIHNNNYRETTNLIQQASSKAMNYDEIMSVIKTSVAEKSLSESQKEELTTIYMSVDREKRKHISKLRSILYANFESKVGKMSNLEVALKYKALDNVQKVQKYLDEFEMLSPDDTQYLKYREQFNRLLTKYKISL